MNRYALGLAAILLTQTACSSEYRSETSSSSEEGDLVSSSAPRVSRVLARDHNAELYCLVRQVNSTEHRVPVFDPSLADWATHSEVELQSFQHESACQPGGLDFSAARLSISKTSRSTFSVFVHRNGERMLWSDRFTYPDPAAACRDCYIHAPADPDCLSGAKDCGKLDDYDAYLYIVDSEAPATAGVQKLVLLDLFDPKDHGAACNAERPSQAIRKLSTPAERCDVPPWLKSLFSKLFPQASGVAPSGAALTEKQTGTGGGYEPP